MANTSVPHAPKLTVEDLTSTIGSVVHGFDASSSKDRQVHAEFLRDLLRERGVIFFRDQELDPDSQEAFASIFGEVQDPGPLTPKHQTNQKIEILQPKGKSVGTDRWHADRSWSVTPPKASILYGVVIPPVGGDTMWASMTAACDTLEPKLRELLQGLTALHSWEAESIVYSVQNQPGGMERYLEMRQKFPPFERPVIEKHPETGQDILYVNSLYTTRIVGLPRAQGDPLLGSLISVPNIPELQVRWRWEVGSMAVWDNWAVQHYAVNDYAPHPRKMHRAVVS